MVIFERPFLHVFFLFRGRTVLRRYFLQGVFTMFSLDNVDLKIIELLESNARISLKDIASRVFLTSPAVSARISKMERAGIIEGYHAHINTAMLTSVYRQASA